MKLSGCYFVDSREFGNYWSGTETYESLMMYIAMDFGGLRQMIVDMLVRISYDKRSRKHQCRIEKFEI